MTDFAKMAREAKELASQTQAQKEREAAEAERARKDVFEKAKAFMEGEVAPILEAAKAAFALEGIVLNTRSWRVSAATQVGS